MMDKDRNDFTCCDRDDIVVEGQLEAIRLRKEVVSRLRHSDLKRLANHVLDIGLQVKESIRKVRKLEQKMDQHYQNQRQILYDDQFQTSNNNCQWDSIATMLNTFQSKIIHLKMSIEERIKSSSEVKKYTDCMEGTYIPAVVALDQMVESYNNHVSWELRYFAISEWNRDTGKTMVTLPFHDNHPNSMDHYCACSICQIQLTLGQRRITSLECSNTIICMDCHEAITHLYNTLLHSKPTNCNNNQQCIIETNQTLSSWNRALKELMTFAPHLSHITAQEDGSTCELRLRAFSNAGSSSKDSLTMRKLLPRFFTMSYSNRPCFGIPSEKSHYKKDLYDPPPNSDSLPTTTTTTSMSIIPYRWFTYKMVWQTVALLSCQLIDILNLKETTMMTTTTTIITRPQIAIFSSLSPIFFTCEISCVAVGLVSVSMDTCWEVTDVIHAITQSSIPTLLLDSHTFELLFFQSSGSKTSIIHNNLLNCLETIIVIATDPFQQTNNNDPSNNSSSSVDLNWLQNDWSTKVHLIFTDGTRWHNPIYYNDAISKLEEYTCSHDNLPSDQYVLGLFSSGTTSGTGKKYKGVLIREEAFRKEHTKPRVGHPLVAALIYSPSWGTGKDMVWSSILSGGRIGLAIPQPGRTTLWQYLYSLKPTWHISLVPALVSQLVEEHHAAAAARLSNTCHPNNNNNSNIQSQQRAIAYARAAEYIYSCIGGNAMEGISIGGAMVNQTHVELLSKILPCGIYQGYGSTEGGGLAITDHNKDELIPMDDGLKTKIISRPDLGYTLDDKPYPRGELLILNDTAATKHDWFGDNDAVATQQLKYTSDGYYSTGDIVESRPKPNSNSFRIIDRASSITKLPDGSFFSPAQVDATVGNLTKFGVTDYMVAVTPHGVVVLVLEISTNMTSKTNKREIITEVQIRCRKAGIKQRCIPRHLILDIGNFSKEGRLWQKEGCYTISGKLIRNKVLRRIKNEMNKIDERELSCSHPSDFSTCLGKDNEIRETAIYLLDSIGIMCSPEEIDNSEFICEPIETIGIDSLLWTKLRHVVKQLLHQYGKSKIEMPFLDISKTTIKDISLWISTVVNEHDADMIQELNTTSLPSQDFCNDVESQTQIEMKLQTIEPELADLEMIENKLFHLLERDSQQSVTHVHSCEFPSRNNNTTKTILLTGATGFLGHQILMNLLKINEQDAGSNMISEYRKIKIICLVRGSSDEDIYSRVVDKISRTSWYRETSSNRKNTLDSLEVILGDMKEPLFGLQQNQYDRLASKIDVIIHAAAAVKTVDFDSSKEIARDMILTNTQGCVAITLLAARSKLFGRNATPVLYISTESVEMGLSSGEIIDRASHRLNTSASSLLLRQPYNVSKLLGETVLIHGSKLHDYPLCIMRPGLLTFSSEGDSNHNDWFVRLLSTISELGISPTKGSSKFLESHMSFESVDNFAEKVVHEAFSLLTTNGKRIRMATSSIDREKFCPMNVLKTLKGPFEAVPPFAFRSAVLFSKKVLPFYPFVHWLIDDIIGSEQPSIDDYNRPHLLKEHTINEEIPESLKFGLRNFLKAHCQDITLP